MNTFQVILKAEDIAHVLRDGIALLPGSRDRTGRAIIIFPPKEHQLNPDNIRNILRYLHTVTADDTRELGFTVIIDMRGKHASNNVRPILKSINHLCETTNGLIIMVLIIKPDTFWEKQKANMLIGSWSFEVCPIPYFSFPFFYFFIPIFSSKPLYNTSLTSVDMNLIIPY
ncbi:hypothetical protein COOONC_28563 [Cooperia oncophora]